MNPVTQASNLPVDLSELNGIQRKVVTGKPHGHTVVLGGSGSGKTVLSVLRALFLCDPEAEHFGRTLLVTYNRSLLAYLNHFIPPGTRRLDARTYHYFAVDYLERTGKLQKGSTVNSFHELSLIKDAREEVRQAAPEEEVLQQSVFMLKPELDWIVQNGLLTEESYINADRSARGGPLPRGALEAIFQVQEAYWRLRSEAGKQYSWEDMPAAVHSALKQDTTERRYKHVVIDEGQDFSPEMLRSLALAIPEDGSLTFFGDVAQQIYCHGSSWRSAGLDVGKVWELDENHRNSPQVARLAAAIEDMPYFEGQADVVKAEPGGEAGPKPTFVRFASFAAEDSFVVKRAEALAAEGSVGVLCRRYEDAIRLGNQLDEGERLNRYLGTWRPGPGIWYGTVHAAKGYEFDSVILVGLTAGKWPEPRVVTQFGYDQAVAVEGRLLYVGVTRARRNLIMTGTGDPTSLLPENDELWVEEERGPTKAEMKAAAEAAEREAAQKAKAEEEKAEEQEAERENAAGAEAESTIEAGSSVEADADENTPDDEAPEEGKRERTKRPAKKESAASGDVIDNSLEEWPDDDWDGPDDHAPAKVTDGPEDRDFDDGSNVVPLRRE